MKINEKIKAAMKEAGLTQQDLADKLKITNPVVNNWCTGRRNPTVKTLKKIAEATGKSFSYFVSDDENISNSIICGDRNNNLSVNNPTITDKMEILSLKMDIMIDLLRQHTKETNK